MTNEEIRLKALEWAYNNGSMNDPLDMILAKALRIEAFLLGKYELSSKSVETVKLNP